MTFIYRIICRLLLFFGYEDKSFELYKKHVMERRKVYKLNDILSVRPEVLASYSSTDLVNLRPTGHGERRVYTIPIRNMNEEELEEYVQRVANSFKSNVNVDHLVDPITGEFDMKYNPLSIDEDIYIPQRNNDFFIPQLRPQEPLWLLYYMDVKYSEPIKFNGTTDNITNINLMI